MPDNRFENVLQGDLQNRLNLIIQEIPHFWERGPYTHFTNHGPSHSERIYHQKLAQLAQELPDDQRLIEDEIFIVSAAAWLYEIGMQSTNLTPTLDFKYHPGKSLSLTQLQQIREHKHLLTQRLIIDNVRGEPDSFSLRLGLVRPADDYTRVIADVCGWCSSEPLEKVPVTSPVRGVEVRVRLMVALLRLADQLYIDSSRVNLDLLQETSLPLKEKARWWAYHYAQTLPIDKGRIRFHYFLPIAHKALLGHIRALIEPDFEYANNSTIRYLWDEHGLRLMPQKNPTVRFDQPSGFQREMSPEMISYLREAITPVKTTMEEEEERLEERNLLILDYENLILDLGLAGYFPSAIEISRMFVTLLTEANNQYTGPIDALAVGHWDRPMLAPIARTLKARVYTLLNVPNQQSTSDTVMQELMQQSQDDDPPKHILLVAPRQDMAPIINRFPKRGQTVSAWISDSPDDIYRAVIRTWRSLPHILGLSSSPESVLSPEQRRLDQEACILRLMHTVGPDKDYLSSEEVAATLQQVEQVKQRADWWHLWLLDQEILLSIQVDGQYVQKLNAEHPAVIEVRAKRDAAVRALEVLAQDGQGVPKDVLVNELVPLALFRGAGGGQERQEYVLRFLGSLNDEGIVHVDTRPSSPTSQPVWFLNSTHPVVIALNASRYLPLLTLGLDHFLVREGYPVIHEHALTRKLVPYVGERIAGAVYQLALQKEWVQRQESSEKRGYRESKVMDVRLTADHKEVQKVLLSRDILLEVLYRKAEGNELARDALWTILGTNNRFTLTKDEMDEWIAVFQRDGLVLVKRDEYSSDHDCLRLNLESLLARRLLGRMNLCGLVLTMRILGATHPERKKPADEVVERMAKLINHVNKQLASWTIEYAKSIRLVEFGIEHSPGGNIDVLFLKRHSFVYNLDQRELAACQALAQLVKTLSQYRSRDGWVARPLVIQEMEGDSRFGSLPSEYDYWINQAIHRHRFLDKRTEYIPGRAPQNYLRVLSQEHH
jgi:hypothetical protein